MRERNSGFGRRPIIKRDIRKGGCLKSPFFISSLFRVLNEIVIPFKFVIFVNDNVVGRV